MNILYRIAMLWLLMSSGLYAQRIDPRIQQQLQSPAHIECLVYFKAQTDLSPAYQLRDWRARGQFVYQSLRNTAQSSQQQALALLQYAQAAHQSFWIVNMIWTVADAATILALAELPEVAYITDNPLLKADQPGTPDVDALSSRAPEWGVLKIQADDVWALGYTGASVVVGGQDTGYDWDHVALKLKYRGWNSGNNTVNHNYNWHDAIHGQNPNTPAGNPCGFDLAEPCDDDGHGTHTMGTMVGGEGSNQVGVAPDAKWISCRNMEQGWGTPATYYECFQWFLAPTDLANGNPDPSLRPHVINNSWGCPPEEGCNTTGSKDSLNNAVNACRAAGIVVVVSAGNSGPNCATINTPAPIFASSFTIGATDSNDAIAGFSSRGPATYESALIKPEVSAPGVNVRSSFPGNVYGSTSGTSMAGPHVAGAVALMLSARPALKFNPDVVEAILKATAIPLTSGQTCGGVAGTQIPNNTFGYGRIDALAAVQAALSSPLPVVLKSFNARIRGSEVWLDWTTETEFNASHFVVERSTDTRHWDILAEVKAQGNSSQSHLYTYTDQKPLGGASYYRLRQMDFDQVADYSAIRQVRFSGNAGLVLAPNPARHSTLLQLEGFNGSAGQTRLLDLSGKLVLQVPFEAGQAQQNLDLSALAGGIYLIELSDLQGLPLGFDKLAVLED